MKIKKSNPIAVKRFFSVREAALYSGLSARLIYQKLKDRVLCHYRVNSKIVIDRADLDELITQNEVRTLEQLRKELKMSSKENKF